MYGGGHYGGHRGGHRGGYHGGRRGGRRGQYGFGGGPPPLDPYGGHDSDSDEDFPHDPYMIPAMGRGGPYQRAGMVPPQRPLRFGGGGPRPMPDMMPGMPPRFGRGGPPQVAESMPAMMPGMPPRRGRGGRPPPTAPSFENPFPFLPGEGLPPGLYGGGRGLPRQEHHFGPQYTPGSTDHGRRGHVRGRGGPAPFRGPPRPFRGRGAQMGYGTPGMS